MTNKLFGSANGRFGKIPWNKGGTHSEEAREKIREARLRQVNVSDASAVLKKWWTEIKNDPIRYAVYRAKLKARSVWNRGKPWSEAMRKQMSIARKGKSNTALIGRSRPDMKGNKYRVGLKLSEEHKMKISLANKGKHRYAGRRRGKDHPFYGKPMPKGTGAGNGSYCAKGHWVRSSWERGVADWLFKQNIAYEYEPQLFDFGNGLRYRPDFYLSEFDRWIEVKGWMTERAKQQIAAFRATGRSLFIIDRHWWRQYTNGRDDLPKEYLAA